MAETTSSKSINAALGIDYRLDGPIDALDEDLIVAGMNLPADVQTYRDQQISGALLAYTNDKVRFDECREVETGTLQISAIPAPTTAVPTCRLSCRMVT